MKPDGYAIVRRLQRVYWPRDILGMYTLERVLRAKPVPEFVREEDPRRCRDSFNLGRVHHFYRMLRRGQKITPIEVETYVSSHSFSYCSWGGPFVQDGHHRFAAAVLAHKRRIPVTFGGLVEQLRWLTGERALRDLPEGIDLQD